MVDKQVIYKLYFAMAAATQTYKQHFTAEKKENSTQRKTYTGKTTLKT